MPRGGKREGAGRPKGSRSAATKDQIAGISDLAKEHSRAAIEALVEVMTQGESEAARVSAANAILDRGYGKPQQSIVGDADAPVAVTMITRRVIDARDDD